MLDPAPRNQGAKVQSTGHGRVKSLQHKCLSLFLTVIPACSDISIASSDRKRSISRCLEFDIPIGKYIE